MAGGMRVNGRDLADLGVTVQTPDGWRDGLQSSDTGRQVPAGAGRARTADRPSTDFRRITVSGYQKGADVDELNSRVRELRALVGRGLLRVSVDDDTDRFFWARGVVQVGEIQPALVAPYHRLTIRLTCLDPLVYGAHPPTVFFGSTAREVPVGTGPSPAILRIGGPVTNPTITYRDFRGAEVGKMGFTVTLGSDQELIVRLDRQQVEDGGGTNRINDWWSSGQFFELSGEHAAGEDGPYPTLEVSPEPGVAQADLYRSWI